MAAKLSRFAGIPLVLDYRDEWDLSNSYLENKRVGRWAAAVQSHMQARVLRQASAILATTKQSIATLSELAKRAGSHATTHCIYNGYDPEDFAKPFQASQVPSRFRLSYTGTLWNLTDISPLARAVSALSQSHAALAAKLDVCVVGRRTPAQQTILEELKKLPCHLDERPYMSHRDVIDLLGNSQCLCVLQAALPGSERVVAAKVFEYMAAKRPILAIAPRGELWRLLEGHPCVGRFEPADVQGITSWLANLMSGQALSHAGALSQWDPSTFSRQAQAAQLAQILRNVTNAPASTMSTDHPIPLNDRADAVSLAQN